MVAVCSTLGLGGMLIAGVGVVQGRESLCLSLLILAPGGCLVRGGHGSSCLVHGNCSICLVHGLGLGCRARVGLCHHLSIGEGGCVVLGSLLGLLGVPQPLLWGFPVVQLLLVPF